MVEAKNTGCLVFGEDCLKEEHSECRGLFLRWAKIVWCQDAKCIWNVPSPQKKIVKKHKDYQPFSGEGYRGICSRPELALDPQTIKTLERKYVLATCSVRSDRGISGHMDFAKLLQGNGTPYGGNIPDPVDAGTAFH